MQEEFERLPGSKLETVITLMSRPVRIVKGQTVSEGVDESLFQETEERELLAAADAAASELAPNMSIPAFLEVERANTPWLPYIEDAKPCNFRHPSKSLPLSCHVNNVKQNVSLVIDLPVTNTCWNMLAIWETRVGIRIAEPFIERRRSQQTLRLQHAGCPETGWSHHEVF